MEDGATWAGAFPRPEVGKYRGVRAPRGCTRDEGGPLRVGLQEQTPNHLKLHGSRALVVSVEGKDIAKTVPSKVQGDERRRTVAGKQLKLYPLARLGVPEDIANLIVFLASDRTSWITGQSISVDGGILHGVIIYPF